MVRRTSFHWTGAALIGLIGSVGVALASRTAPADPAPAPPAPRSLTTRTLPRVAVPPAATRPTEAPRRTPRIRWTQAEMLDALRQVEASGRDRVADGDGGQAIGPYQVWRSYWKDALAFDPSLAWRTDLDGFRRAAAYEDCRERAYAERVVAAYMSRYARDAWISGDAETVARTHNGGPRGPSKQATLRFWRKVEAALPE